MGLDLAIRDRDHATIVDLFADRTRPRNGAVIALLNIPRKTQPEGQALSPATIRDARRPADAQPQ